MNNKKKLLIASASTLGLAAIGLGAFAYFNDSADLEATATVGTVDVSATGSLAHSGGLNNLNPGDNDPTVPKNYRDGSDHELSFEVENNGTKSVMTRAVIKVTGEDANGAISALDLMNIILSEKTATTALDDTKSPANRDSITVLTPTGHNTNELVYIVGDTADWALNGTEETETGVTGTTMTKKFDLGLKKEVSAEAWEGATITITVEVQAMQYRNTGSGEWDTIFTQAYTTGGAPRANQGGTPS